MAAAVSAATLGLLACGAALCLGAQSVRINATFTAERLGKPTTVSLGFRVAADTGGLPSPLSGLDFHFPANLGIVTSGLGVASCLPQVLEEQGPASCPANSIMGAGSALARFQVEPSWV